MCVCRERERERDQIIKVVGGNDETDPLKMRQSG